MRCIQNPTKRTNEVTFNLVSSGLIHKPNVLYWNDQGYWLVRPANAQPPVYVNNEPPEGQIDEGDLWYNTGDGLMYVYYAPDPSGSNQWVSIGGGGVVQWTWWWLFHRD